MVSDGASVVVGGMVVASGVGVDRVESTVLVGWEVGPPQIAAAKNSAAQLALLTPPG